MSQQAVSYPPYVMVPVREGNGLGVAGFFIALIGLFIPTGIVALLGMLISLAFMLSAPLKFILGQSLNMGNLCISVHAGRVIIP